MRWLAIGVLWPALAAAQPLAGVTDVVTGGGAAGCALVQGGSVACWGWPGPAVLFDLGRREPLPGPWPVKGVSGAVSLARGTGQQSCAVLRDATVRCWRGDQEEKLPVAGVAELALGNDHACARHEDGTVSCWGKNGNCALGRPGKCGYDVSPPQKIAGIRDARQVSASGDGTCVVHANGGLTCWGAHPFLKLPVTDPSQFAPAPVRGVPPVARLSVGFSLGCLVARDDRVMCVQSGQVWSDTVPTGRLLVIEPSAQLRAAVDVAAGPDTAWFVTADGSAWRWGPGRNASGRIDPAWAAHVKASYLRATRLGGITDATRVSAGPQHVCFATRGGRARCLGDNTYGQLGDGTVASRDDQPTTVVSFRPDALPEPRPGLNSCKADVAVRRSCVRAGITCHLLPPPGFWNCPWNSGVAPPRDFQQKCQEEKLARQGLPPCLCSCSPEYKRLAEQERQKPVLPIP